MLIIRFENSNLSGRPREMHSLNSVRQIVAALRGADSNSLFNDQETRRLLNKLAKRIACPSNFVASKWEFLMDKIINPMRHVHGHFQCGYAIIQDQLLLENYPDSYSDSQVNSKLTSIDQLVCFTQIVLIMRSAYLTCQLLHNDLTLKNIVFRRLRLRGRYLAYDNDGKPIYLQSAKYIPVIQNFHSASARVNHVRYGTPIVSGPHQELYQLFMQMQHYLEPLIAQEVLLTFTQGPANLYGLDKVVDVLISLLRHYRRAKDTCLNFEVYQPLDLCSYQVAEKVLIHHDRRSPSTRLPVDRSEITLPYRPLAFADSSRKKTNSIGLSRSADDCALKAPSLEIRRACSYSNLNPNAKPFVPRSQ